VADVLVETGARLPALELGEDAEAFRAEVREFIDRFGSDVAVRHLDEGADAAVVAAARQQGYLTMAWPCSAGGSEAPVERQTVLSEEFAYARLPLSGKAAVDMLGTAILRHGTEEQKQRLLPLIGRGDFPFYLGYSEPEVGSDLAALRTRAVRDGDEYVINGAKVFTSGADLADYVWLAVRTDPEAPKHKGISIICVPTDSAGFSWSPIVTVAGATTTATYYSDVRVPIERRVGEENEGWRMITTQLNHERVGLAAWSGFASQLYEETAAWAAGQLAPDGSSLLDLGWVRSDLARCKAELEAMYLLNWKMATSLAADTMSPADSSTVKIFGVERSMDIYRRLLGIVGAGGYLRPESAGAVLQGRLERTARHAQINTFGGGVNEIQREIVAMAGLGMKRAAR